MAAADEQAREAIAVMLNIDPEALAVEVSTVLPEDARAALQEAQEAARLQKPLSAGSVRLNAVRRQY